MCDRCRKTASDCQYAAFCGAMIVAGYQPVNPAAYHWQFRAAVNWYEIRAENRRQDHYN
jgi:hypothetical protein